MEPFVRVSGASKVFRGERADEVRALADVDLRVSRGEALVLRGPSGSGKTTLLSLVGCMARPTTGRVAVEGEDVSAYPERFLAAVRRRTVGFIFQSFHLVRGLPALENVLLPLLPLGLPFDELGRRGLEALGRFNLANRASTRVERLSGGEQQRVAIARALINDPALLVADEPTAHLDRALAIDLAAILAGLKAEGRTLVIATHDPFLHDQPFIDRIVDLADGRIVGETAR